MKCNSKQKSVPGTETFAKTVPGHRRKGSYLYLKTKKHVTESNPAANSSVCCLAVGCAGGMGSGTVSACACHGPGQAPLPLGKMSPGTRRAQVMAY